MNTLPYRIVDAFTAAPFSGNPAAVLVLPADLNPILTEAEMAAIAAEMNLSETAFVHPPDEDGARRLRWFTPTTEVQLCGHATLASARCLLEDGAPFPLRFQTLSGLLEVHREDEDCLRLDFPSDPPVEAPAPAGLLDALCIPEAARSEVRAFQGRNLWLIELPSEATVAALRPDMTRLGAVELGTGPQGSPSLGVTVTAPASEAGLDFVSRFFGPWVGVNEDPVTGVAHTLLTPHWCRRWGRDELRARQISPRSGDLTVRDRGERVHLVGRAALVAQGEVIRPGAAWDRSVPRPSGASD